MRASQAAAGESAETSPGVSAKPEARVHPRMVTLTLILAAGLVHGLFYVFLIPPWQHYDEPNHFEYVWLVANRPGLPQPGDYDVAMRRAVALSMQEHDFFRGVGMPPDLDSQDSPAWIGGYSQLDEPPLYYLIASLPARVLNSTDITTQLIVTRFVSLVLFLFTILAGWGVSGEIFPKDSAIRWLAPASIALLPGFVDLMTAVNNDAGAVAFFSAFLWASARLVRRGFSIFTALWAVLAATACVYTKSTAMLAVPLLPLALLLSLTKGRWRSAVWIVAIVGVFAGLILLLDGDDAAVWYRSTLQSSGVRGDAHQTVLGEKAIRLETGADNSPDWIPALFQPIPTETGKALQGKVVTLGAWMWADRPVEVRSPELHQANQAFYKTVKLTTEPAFFAITAQLNASKPRLWVSLNPSSREKGTNTAVYLDGLVLAEGERPESELPHFSTPQSGEWGGLPFVNLIQNGSAEQEGLRFKPWADRAGAKILPDRTLPSLLLTSVLDLKNARWFYWQTTIRLFRTFWGQFGWGHVPLLGSSPYRYLGYLCLAMLAGAIGGLVWLRHRLPRDVVLLLGAAMIAVWLAAFLRAPVYMATTRFFLPVARYAYPAIIPTMFFLVFGGWSLLQLPVWIGQKITAAGKELVLPLALNWPAVVILVLLISLDFYAIFSILAYY